MKKTLLVFIFLTAGLVVLGEEITLDTLLERITETSYRKEMYELEQKKTEALEKFYKIDNYNGVKSFCHNKIRRYRKNIQNNRKSRI